MTRLAGTAIVAAVLAGVVVAPALAPNPGFEQHRDFLYAPPMRIRLVDAEGHLRPPFVYPVRLVDRLERRYEEDRARPLPLRWFSSGRIVRLDGEPLLLLGADSLGRDVFSRLLEGGRISLGVAILAALAALVIGACAGSLAGLAGGPIDEALMRSADFVLVLPTIYVLLALRAVLPLVLPTPVLVLMMVVLLAAVGWPYVARGVRAIVAVERSREYAEAARSLGAGRWRLLVKHLLPATRGFLLVQATLLVPAFVLAEATLSYTGLGFSEPTPSWGSMLREVANVTVPVDFPWLLAPAFAMIAFVLGLNLLMSPDEAADALTFALDPARGRARTSGPLPRNGG